jgi:hypothetical protein
MRYIAWTVRCIFTVTLISRYLERASATVNSGSLSDLSNVTNATLYGFEDYHGMDIGVVKAARLWYSCVAGELLMEIPIEEGDTRLGFAISRTEEVCS